MLQVVPVTSSSRERLDGRVVARGPCCFDLVRVTSGLTVRLHESSGSGAAKHVATYVSPVLELLGDRELIAVLGELPSAPPCAIEGPSLQQLHNRSSQASVRSIRILQQLANSDVVAAWTETVGGNPRPSGNRSSGQR